MKRESMADLLAVFVLLGGAGLAVAADRPSAATNEQADAASAEAAARAACRGVGRGAW